MMTETETKTEIVTRTDTTRWTADMYFGWSRPDDETRYEILDGVLEKMASPTFFHQTIVTRLTAWIFIFLQNNPIGRMCVSPVDVQLGEKVVIPDLVFVHNDKAHIIGEKRIVGAPSLVVEVLSLSTVKRDVITKHALYAEHGVEEYWQVNPDAQTIEVLVLEDGIYTVLGIFERDDVVQSPMLAGFEMVAADLFQA